MQSRLRKCWMCFMKLRPTGATSDGLRLAIIFFTITTLSSLLLRCCCCCTWKPVTDMNRTWSWHTCKLSTRRISRYCSRQNYILCLFMVRPLLGERPCEIGCILATQQALCILCWRHTKDQWTVCCSRSIVWASASQRITCTPTVAAEEDDQQLQSTSAPAW